MALPVLNASLIFTSGLLVIVFFKDFCQLFIDVNEGAMFFPQHRGIRSLAAKPWWFHNSILRCFVARFIIFFLISQLIIDFWAYFSKSQSTTF